MTEATAIGKAAREACEKFPDTPSRTLARMLHERHPKLFPTIESARSVIRHVRGNIGKRCRKDIADKKLFRPNGKAGWTMPDFIEERWDPVDLPGPAVVGILSDLQIPFVDKTALGVAVDYLRKKYKLTHLLLNGDVFDFHIGSPFHHDPFAIEMTDEMTIGARVMLWLREVFPGIPFYFKEGNHDERWSRWLASGGSVVLAREEGLRLEAMLTHRIDSLLGKGDGQRSNTLRPYGWEYVTDQRRIQVGKLPVLHGHELKISSSVQPARTAFLKATHTCLIGHLHQTSQFTKQNMLHEEIACFSTGCLCGLSPKWLRVNAWNHGFAVVEVAANGEFDVHNFRIADGKVRAS